MADRLGLAFWLEAEPRPKSGLVAPRTPVEARLARIWCEVLGVEHVGVRDRFLSVGGDSMLATMLIARVRDEMQVELSMLDFFEASTIEDQAKLIASVSDAADLPPDASTSAT
jgi:acyl carrier protein